MINKTYNKKKHIPLAFFVSALYFSVQDSQYSAPLPHHFYRKETQMWEKE